LTESLKAHPKVRLIAKADHKTGVKYLLIIKKQVLLRIPPKLSGEVANG
jgi:hypothetical protein